MSAKIEVAVIGLVGVLAGSFLSIAGQVVTHCLQRRSQAKIDAARKDLLKRMLEHPDHTWRNFPRLMHVVGADEETTKRLLLELGARGSEDGQNLWGLVSRNPFQNEI
jgi:hypothetical protein